MAKAPESTLASRRTQRVQHATTSTGLKWWSFFCSGHVLIAVLVLAVVGSGSDAFQLTNQHQMQPLSVFSHSQAQHQEKHLTTIQDREWLLQMNEQLQLTEIGALDRKKIDFLHIMNAWAKQKSTQGAERVFDVRTAYVIL